MQYSTVIVDDDDDDRAFLHYGFIENKILDVGLFKDAPTALYYLFNQAVTLPKLIVSDYNMPLLTGIEFVQQLKNAEKLSSIPVIIFSTYMPATQVTRCIAAGALGYHLKPKSADEIVQLIKDIVAPIFNVNDCD
jgi:CheY-like chemotaxis protein